MAIQSAKITLGIQVAKTRVGDFNGNDVTAVENLNHSVSQALTEGEGANAIESAWNDRRTLASAAADNLDLNALTDIFGQTVNFSAVKGLYIRNNSTTDNLLIGGNANAFGLFAAANDELKLPPGGEILLKVTTAAGIAVSNGSTDILDITHAGDTSASLTYDIAIIGISA